MGSFIDAFVMLGFIGLAMVRAMNHFVYLNILYLLESVGCYYFVGRVLIFVEKNAISRLFLIRRCYELNFRIFFFG